MPTVASETPAPNIAYRLHAAELIVTLRTDERQGLGDEEAGARLAQYGLNELAAHKAVPAWRRFLSQFQDVLVILLLIATAISAAIFAVVLVNATMGYIQESRAEAAVAALRKMSAPNATVIREGERRSVPASQIVPGDIILIEEGDTIPADGRLIESAALPGRSVASTMGFTSLDGLAMGTRCGAVDPGVMLYLMDERGLDARAIEDLVYHRSGLLGVSDLSSDMHTLLATDEPRARTAIDLYVYRIRRELGSLAAAARRAGCHRVYRWHWRERAGDPKPRLS